METFKDYKYKVINDQFYEAHWSIGALKVDAGAAMVLFIADGTVNVAQAEGAISGSLGHGLDVTHVKRLGTRGGLACSNWTPCEEMGGELN